MKNIDFIIIVNSDNIGDKDSIIDTVYKYLSEHANTWDYNYKELANYEAKLIYKFAMQDSIKNGIELKHMSDFILTMHKPEILFIEIQSYDTPEVLLSKRVLTV